MTGLVLVALVCSIPSSPYTNHWRFGNLGSRPLAEALQAPEKAQIIIKMPPTLAARIRKDPAVKPKDIEAIRKVLAKTTSGTVLARCLLALSFYEVPGDELAAPQKKALRDYFSKFLFYDFQPDLFWPHYPGNWQQGMRNVLAHAIRTNYRFENLNHALCVMPMFFTEAQAGRIYALESLAKAAEYGTWNLHMAQYNGYWHDIGLRFWIGALWKTGDEKRHEEIVNALFVRPLVEGRAHSHYNREDLFPFHEWLRDHPDRMREYLESKTYALRQFTLLWALSRPRSLFYSRRRWVAWDRLPESDFLLDPENPDTIGLLLEGLRNDGISRNESFCVGMLSSYSTFTLPFIIDGLRESTDRQQASLLCGVLISIDTAESRVVALDYLWRLLATAEKTDVPLCDSGYGGRTRWAAYRLIEMGDPARDYILRNMKTSSDPQQIALCLLVLQHLKGLRFVRWDDRLVEILARGLVANDVKHDQGFCAAALKLGKPEALNALKRIAANPKDEQLRVSAEVLIPYLEGDIEEYIKRKRQHGGMRYWSDDRLYWEYTSEHNWRWFLERIQQASSQR